MENEVIWHHKVPSNEQFILAKKELTVTDPNMTRFLMTLSESVDLVFYAFQSNESGNIYVKKSPSCTILNLVKALGIIFNYEPKIKLCLNNARYKTKYKNARSGSKFESKEK